MIFPVIGRKDYRSSISDADREISTLESSDNADFRHYPFTLGLGFRGLHRRPMTDSIFHIECHQSANINDIYLSIALSGLSEALIYLPVFQHAVTLHIQLCNSFMTAVTKSMVILINYILV